MDCFRDEDGNPQMLPSIKKAIGVLHQQRTELENHMSSSGDRGFIDLALSLAYGKKSQSLKERRIAGVQTMTGSAGYNLLIQFLRRSTPRLERDSVFYTTKPTSPINDSLLAFNDIAHVRLTYYDRQTHSLDLQALVEALREIPDGSIVLLHGCSHNPTGLDPSPEEWRSIADEFVRKRHFAVIDMEYQGVATGDLERDGHCVRLWEDRGLEFCVLQSFSHNTGLYGETVGVLSFVCENSLQASAVQSYIGNVCARQTYGTPPRHGSDIIKVLVADEMLEREWRGDLSSMASRCALLRRRFVGLLAESAGSDRWTHLQAQVGKFSYLSLSADQLLRDKSIPRSIAR